MILAARRHKGFTLLEITLASGLMVLLALLLASAWVTAGKSIVNLTARSQLAQEMDFAVAAISRDLGGWPVNPQGQLVAGLSTPIPWSIDPTDPTNVVLTLTLANGDKITYQRDASNADAWKHNNLIRTYNGTLPFTVARNVDDFLPSLNSDGTLRIQIDFSCNYPPQSLAPTSHDRENSIIKRTCVLVAKGPPS